MCIKHFKRLFRKKSCKPLANEKTEQAEKLTLKQFNVLINMPQRIEDSRELCELDNNEIRIDTNVIKSINSTTLPSEAVSFIENKDNSISRNVILIAEEGGRYYVTEEGLRYIKYYYDKYLSE